MKRIILIGARLNGQAGVVLDLLSLLGHYQLVGFVDNTPELQGKSVCGVPILGKSEELADLDIPADCVHIAIGDNVARSNLYKVLKGRGVPVETLVHPRAVISPRATIGEGSFIGPLAIVNNGAQLGPVCLINSAAIVEHDNRLGEAVQFGPGARSAGNVTVGDYSFVGIGASILPKIRVGSGVVIGGGATVIKDVTDRTTVIGYAAQKKHQTIYQDVKAEVGNITAQDLELILNHIKNRSL